MIAIGNGVVYRKAQRQAAVSSGDPKQEQEKFNEACATAKAQLSALYEKAVKELGAEKAAIVEVQMLMLEDLDYLEAVAAEIAAGTPAATAASECGEGIAQCSPVWMMPTCRQEPQTSGTFPSVLRTFSAAPTASVCRRASSS